MIRALGDVRREEAAAEYGPPVLLAILPGPTIKALV